jgi:hypothetical protein
MSQSFGTFLRHNRRYVVGILVIVVALLLITSFSTFESGRGGIHDSSGWKLDGADLRLKDLTAMDRALRAQALFGQPAGLEIRQAVLFHALMKEAQSLGIKPTPQQIERFFQSGPFQFLKMMLIQEARREMPIAREEQINAQMQVKLEQRLKQLGLKNHDLDDYARRMIERQELERFIAATAKLTPLAIQQKQEFYIETFTVDVFNVPTSTFANAFTITPDEIKKEYEDSKVLHVTPRRVRVLYARVPAEKFKDKVNVTDEQIERYYEQNKKDFVTDKGEQKKLEDVKAEIREKLLMQAAARPAFEAASEIAERLYTTPRPANLSPADLRAYYEANAKTFTDALGNPLAFEAIMADEKLTAALRHRAAMTIAFQECIARSNPALQLSVQMTDWFDKGSVMETVKFGPAFRDEALALSPDRVVGNAIRDENDSYVIAFLDQLLPAQLPLERVESKIREALTNRKQREETFKAVEKYVSEIRARLDKGMTLAEAVEPLKLTSTALKPFNLINAAKVLSTDEMLLVEPLMNDIGEESAGAITPPVAGRTSVMFAYIRDRKQGDPNAHKEELAQLRNRITEEYSSDVWRDWLSYRLRPRLEEPPLPVQR